MIRSQNLLPLLVFICSTGVAQAQCSMTGVNAKGIEQLLAAPKSYTAVKVSDPITLDGKLDEKTWANAPWTDNFVDIEGDRKPTPRYNTRVKMAWDDQYLYFAAQIEDPHIWANLYQRDQIVFYDNDFEIFIDPDGDNHNYYEYEVNALGTIFDLLLVKTYRVGGPPILDWDFKGLKQGVSIDGTANDPSDVDRKWTVEVAIPFSSLAFEFVKPSLEKPWRINFSRVEWDTKVVNGAYVKEVNPSTGKNKPENNWVWSPQGVINMHCPERWGYLSFSKSTTLEGGKAFEQPQVEQAKNALWALFYRQQEYVGKHGRYAKELDNLGFSKSITVNAVPYTLLLETTTSLYQATLLDNDGKVVVRINSEGKIF